MSRGTKMVLVGAAGVVAGIAMVFGLLTLAGSGDPDVQFRLGDDVFEAGRTDSLADAIDRDGPIALPDLVGRGRPIYVNHLEESLDAGWVAILAIPPGSDCVIEWDRGEEEFVDPCTDRSYAADGEALTRYATRVEDDRLYIDLRDQL